jgi:hypothetical protein
MSRIAPKQRGRDVHDISPAIFSSRISAILQEALGQFYFLAPHPASYPMARGRSLAANDRIGDVEA